MHFLWLILVILLSTSCSVQIKEAKKPKSLKPYTISMKQENKNVEVVKKSEENKAQEVKKQENLNINNGSDIAKLINYQLSVEDKNFIIKESSLLNMPIPQDEDIEYFLNYYATYKKYFTENAFKRANYFLPMVKRAFREQGLPEDLAYLAIVESGFNPYATSPSNAAGIWQFIPSTGKRFGLRIDDYIDERRDPYKSTIAAAKYLKSLYELFGSYELAIAGYNCGEKCIQKRVESTGSYRFSDIKYALPKETTEYVPRFFAILLISRDPKRYNIDTDSNIYDMVTFTVERDISLEDYAIQNNMDLDILKFYNAHLRKGIAFEGTGINIPKLDTAFDKRYIYLPPQNSNQTVIVKQSKPVKDNIQANQKRDDNIILSVLEKDQKPDIVKTSSKNKLYRVEKGDTLYSIAKRFGMSVEDLKRLNRLESVNINDGDILVIGE